MAKRYNKEKKFVFRRVFFIIIILTLLILGIMYGFDFVKNNLLNVNTSNTLTSQDEHQESPKKEPITFTLTALGDILCHNTQYMDAYNSSTGLYDFSYVFDDIKEYTSKRRYNYC